MGTFGRAALIVGGVVLASAWGVAAQTPSKKPQFEVVSIKPSPANLTMRGGGPRGDRMTLAGASLRMLVGMAYRTPGASPGFMNAMEVVGGPDWTDSALYEVQAKADCSAGTIPADQMTLMMQSMLEERFQLKARVETREAPVYNLVVAKDGHKLTASADQTPPPLTAAGAALCGPIPAGLTFPPPPPPPPPGGAGAGAGARGMPSLGQAPRGAMMIMLGGSSLSLQATSATMSSLSGMLRQMVGRPVIDKTDLKGLFDVALQFSPEGLAIQARVGGAPPPPGAGAGGPPSGPAGATVGTPFGPAAGAPVAGDPAPSLFSAIQDLGLRLESSRGPVEVVVIESAQKPSEN